MLSYTSVFNVAPIAFMHVPIFPIFYLLVFGSGSRGSLSLCLRRFLLSS